MTYLTRKSYIRYMETTTKVPLNDKVENGQGMQMSKEEINKGVTPQKEQLTMAGNQRKQGRSTSYALKAFSGHLETLSEENLITPAEAETIKKIHKNATIMYMQKELGVMLD